MSSDITKYFGSDKLAHPSDRPGTIVTKNSHINKRTGAYEWQIATNDGRMTKQIYTKTGASINHSYQFPEYHSIAERNMYIRDLYLNGLTQEEIAIGYNLSQPTVSRVLDEE